MESACGAFSTLPCVCKIQYSVMKWRVRYGGRGKKEIKKLWNFSTLHCQLLLTSLGTYVITPPTPAHTPHQPVNEDVIHELNTFMGTF